MRRLGSRRAATSWLARVAIVAAGMALCWALPAAAQPDLSQTTGTTVADRASPHYRFERFVVASADGTRRWRVNLGIPKKPAPASGSAALYMLDGNAALMSFDDGLLADLAAARPCVLVFIGYDNDLRIDSPGRMRDYTPSIQDAGKPSASGGADAFLDTIEQRIKPEVERRAAVDRTQQLLWGHSLGGVFALHALFTRTSAFQIYVPASAALWWDNGLLLREVERFAAHNAGTPARVWVMRGGAEGQGRRDNTAMNANDPRVTEMLKRRQAAPPDAAKQMARRLESLPGLQVQYREFDGLDHGPSLKASLLATLHELTGIADRSLPGAAAP